MLHRISSFITFLVQLFLHFLTAKKGSKWTDHIELCSKSNSHSYECSFLWQTFFFSYFCPYLFTYVSLIDWLIDNSFIHFANDFTWCDKSNYTESVFGLLQYYIYLFISASEKRKRLHDVFKRTCRNGKPVVLELYQIKQNKKKNK